MAEEHVSEIDALREDVRGSLERAHELVCEARLALRDEAKKRARRGAPGTKIGQNAKAR